MRKLKTALICLLFAGMILPTVSCEVTHRTAVRTTTVKKKKAHPHGGPPGQTKKKAGHPGKVH